MEFAETAAPNILLKGYTAEQLSSVVGEAMLPPRIARKLQTMIFKRGINTLPDRLEHVARAKWDSVKEQLCFPDLEIIDRQTSSFDGFRKYLFRSHDGARFEAVRIPLLHRPGQEKYVVCVSTQVGCSVGCAFCATGRMGLKRNLETWEIVDQAFKIHLESNYPVRGIVFMGMGEPFLNYDNTVRAAQVFSDPCGMSIDGKSITVSTAGIVPMIRRFARERHPYRLITSLHAATDELRRELVPINQFYPLAAIISALKEYEAAKNRRVILAWTMIRGVNMSREQMRALRALVGDMRIILDLIPVNDNTGQFAKPSAEEIQDFVKIVAEELQCPMNVRYSGGEEVEGACGMLATKDN